MKQINNFYIEYVCHNWHKNIKNMKLLKKWWINIIELLNFMQYIIYNILIGIKEIWLSKNS